MADIVRCQCGSIDFTDEDESKPYETPRAIHWVDRPCESKPQPALDVEARLRAFAERHQTHGKEDAVNLSWWPDGGWRLEWWNGRTWRKSRARTLSACLDAAEAAEKGTP